MFGNFYKKMSLMAAINSLKESVGCEGKSDYVVACVSAIMTVLPKEAETQLSQFTDDWNFNNPYEYYQREVVVLLERVIESNLGKPVSFFGRILGKRPITWDTVVSVREV